MDWNKAYSPERRAKWDDLARAVQDAVTMEDVLDYYCPSTPRRNRRCPCPIHNGKDYNFSYYNRYYKCFVCGAFGDVIEFVKTICELSTRSDAIRRINGDFHLNLPITGYATPSQNSEMRKRRETAEKKKAEIAAWTERYNALMDEYAKLDKVLNSDSVNQDSEWLETLAKARERIEAVKYEIDSMPPEPR